MFLRSGVPPAFAVRVVTVAPGAELAYDEGQWRDAIVAVERGELELECLGGGRRRFARGSALWLSGLPLRALRSVDRDPLLLIAVSRPSDEPTRLQEPAEGPAGQNATLRDAGGALLALQRLRA